MTTPTMGTHWDCCEQSHHECALAKLAAAQEALHFVERWANHHGVKPTCSAEAALSTIQHYPPILAITRGYADGKVPETRNPWAELEAAQEAIRYLVDHQGHFQTKHAPAIDAAMRKP